MRESAEKFVFLSLNVDMDVTASLRQQASKEVVSNGEMFRRYLKAGTMQSGAAEGSSGLQLLQLVRARRMELSPRAT